MITCTIDNGKEKYKQTISSKNTVKELIHSIKKNYISSSEKEQMINLYYKGRQLTKEDECLENICNNDELDLVMVSISLTDSIRNDKTKTQEALIQKLSKECSIHKGDKELNLCITCGMAFCQKCEDSHKDHKTINKKDFIKFQDDIKNNQETMNKAFENLGFINDSKISDDVVCKNLRNEMEDTFDNLNELVRSISKKQKYIYTDFKTDFDMIFPILLEYKEKIDMLFDATKKETTLRNEKEFLDFYCKYKKIQNSNDKINDKIIDLKNKIENFKDILSDLLTKTRNSVENIKKEFENFENTNLLNNNHFNHNEISSNNLDNKNKAPSELRASRFSSTKNPNNCPRLNLVNLLSPPKDKKAFIKTVEQQIKEKKGNSPGSTHNLIGASSLGISSNKMLNYKQLSKNKIDEQNGEDSVLSDEEISPITKYYTIEVGSTNLLIYTTTTKKLEKQKINLLKTNIKRFEAFHSTLNYKGYFYISGGYSTSKMFHKFNAKTSQFMKLSDMPSGHSYHCLLGVNGFIFAISGFKSKKVEKFTINKNVWTSLPETEVSRSWPGCVSVDDTYILLFGGLCDKIETTNKIIEKLNIKDPAAQWEKIELTFNEPIPFYFGVVNINNEQVLLFGGKLNAKEDDVNTCYKFNSNNISLEIDQEIKLPNKDEFDGKTFFTLGEDKYGIFSSIHSENFYIFDSKNKEFEVITLEETNTK